MILVWVNRYAAGDCAKFIVLTHCWYAVTHEVIADAVISSISSVPTTQSTTTTAISSPTMSHAKHCTHVATTHTTSSAILAYYFHPTTIISSPSDPTANLNT